MKTLSNMDIKHEYAIETSKSTYEYDIQEYKDYWRRPYSPDYVKWLEDKMIEYLDKG